MIRPARRMGGFSLIELMVAATIFLVLSIAIFQVLSTNEGQKRTTTSVNDIDQGGNYALYQIGNLLRSAGAGLTHAYAQTYGCRINEVESSTTVYPITSNTIPAPFGGVYAVTGSPRVAPVLIVKGVSSVVGSTATVKDSSDVIIVMSSTAGYDQLGISSIQTPTGSSLNLQNNATISASDLLLLSDSPGATGMAPCLVEQVATSATYHPTTAAGVVPLAGTFATTTATDQNLSSYSLQSTALDLGNITGTPSNPPNFLMLGVGTENVGASGDTSSALYSYDILQLAGVGTAPTQFVDNVFEIHALYGIDTTGSGSVNAWQDPGTAPYDAATLMNGSTASNANLAKIMAIRIGVILRSSLPEQNPVQAPAIVLFSDLPTANQVTCNVCAAETNYRWRAFDTIIALRNPLYLGQ